MAVAAATMAARTSRSLLSPGPGASLPGKHTVSPRTERESSGEVSGVLYGRRALADEPEQRRAALPRPPDGDDRAADGPRPIWAARVISNGRQGPRGGRCFKYRPPPGRPLLIVTPELRGAPGGQDRPSRPGPLLP